MSVLSKSSLSKLKLFDGKILTCEEIFHPNKTCWQAFLQNMPGLLASNAKLFAPIAFLPLMFKIRKWSKDVFGDAVKHYCQLTLTGFLIANVIVPSICILRNIFGRFYYLTYFTVPTFLGGMSILFFNIDRIDQILVATFSQGVIEVQLRAQSNFLTRAIWTSEIVKTLLFMCQSAIILHIVRQHGVKIFWFTKASSAFSKMRKENLDDRVFVWKAPKCTHHPDACRTYIYKGLRNSAIIGLTVELLTAFTAKTETSSQLSKNLILKMKKLRLNAFAFVTFYTGIYRILECYLNNRVAKNNNDMSHLIAAFTAGISFTFYPKSSFFSYGLSSAVQLLWYHFVTKSKVENSKAVSEMRKIPWKKFLVPAFLAYLVHTRIFHPELVSGLTIKLISGTTNKLSEEAGEKLRKYFQSL